MRHLLLLGLIAAQAPQIRFEPVQPDLLAAGGSFVNAFADYDLDGDVDLFVGFNATPNRLYRSDKAAQGGPTLVDVAATAGIADARGTRAAAWGDFDGDRDPDLLVGFAPGTESVLKLYSNDGGKFVDVTKAAGLEVGKGAVRQPSWIDVDGDDDLDLFVAFRDRPNALFQNTAGKFTDIAGAIGLADARKSVGAVWFDMDEDGDLDLYVANMDGDANGLFRQDSGKFTDVAEEAGVAWGGRAPKEATNGTVRPCAADVNGDGRFDLFTANYGPNGLFLNKGGATFEDVSKAWGVAALTDGGRYDTCAFTDVDHDGRLDVYVNGTITGGTQYRDYLLRNTGSAFEDVTPANLRALNADHGAQWADVDGDGDEDLALTGAQPDGMHALLRNLLPEADARRAIRIRVGDAERRAVRAGAEIRAYAAGTRKLVAARLVDTGSGYDAQNDMPVTVSLPSLDPVDFEVTYPKAGQRLATLNRNIDPRMWHGKVLGIMVPVQAGPVPR
jgi:hypothetical protein